jgi:hypothetical protein
MGRLPIILTLLTSLIALATTLRSFYDIDKAARWTCGHQLVFFVILAAQAWL